MSELSLTGITVRFGGHTALNDVHLTVQSGSVTGLIGPNGAGKTTLFNVISGLLKPNEGSIRFHNEVMTELSPYRRAKLGLGRTFQRLELFPSLSVAENIQVAAEIREEWFPSSVGTSSVSSSVQRVMKLTGLDSVASKSVAEIPTGKARLVELARTVVQGPSMLLLDEPASGQNESETDEFAQILKILNTEGITILLVEHDMSLVMDVCEKVFVLDFGTLIADGSTEEIQNNPVVVDAYLGGTNG